jgi:hypothetical protein
MVEGAPANLVVASCRSFALDFRDTTEENALPGRANEPHAGGGPMARQRPAPTRIRRTREHVIADLSINHVERQALLCGSSVERIQHDYGVDLFVLTYDRHGQRENGEILFQVKATDRLRFRAGGQAVAYRVEASDLRSWLREPMPVILVLYDARKEVGYWLYLQAHFEDQPGFDFRDIGQRVTGHGSKPALFG